MRFLSPAEAETLLTRPRYSVSLTNSWYRSALLLDPELAGRQTRIAAEQPSDIGTTSRFVMTLNRWLPTDEARLLWVDHWEVGNFGVLENALAAAAWRGLGEVRPPKEAPGLFFDAQNWGEEDQIEVTLEQAEARGVMVGIVALMMMSESDGWLVAPGCTDRIEFWEGNFFFHSETEEKIRQAEAIISAFGCRRWES
jgi:hypothetical protein